MRVATAMIVAVVAMVRVVLRSKAGTGDHHFCDARSTCEALHPGVEAEAVGENHAGVLQPARIRGAGLEGVGVFIRAYQRGNGNPLTADLPHQVGEDAETRCHRHRLGGAYDGRQEQGRKERNLAQQVFHDQVSRWVRRGSMRLTNPSGANSSAAK